MSGLDWKRSACFDTKELEAIRVTVSPVQHDAECFNALQASAKWRLLWRLAPGLYRRMDASGRLGAMYAAIKKATRAVRAHVDVSCINTACAQWADRHRHVGMFRRH